MPEGQPGLGNSSEAPYPGESGPVDTDTVLAMTLRVKGNITNNFQLETAEPEATFGTLLRAGTMPLTAHWVCSRSPAYTQALSGTSQQGHWPAGAEMPVFSAGPLTRLQFSRYLGGDPRKLREVGK